MKRVFPSVLAGPSKLRVFNGEMFAKHNTLTILEDKLKALIQSEMEKTFFDLAGLAATQLRSRVEISIFSYFISNYFFIESQGYKIFLIKSNINDDYIKPRWIVTNKFSKKL